MNEVDMVIVETTEEHDDGSATFTCKLSEGVREKLASEGLKLTLYCAAADIDMQLVYSFIEDHIKYNQDELTEYEFGHEDKK